MASKLGFFSFFLFFIQHAPFCLLVLWMEVQCSKKQDRFLFPFHDLPRDQLLHGWGFRGCAAVKQELWEMCPKCTGTSASATGFAHLQPSMGLPLVLWLRNGVQGTAGLIGPKTDKTGPSGQGKLCFLLGPFGGGGH